MVRSEHADAVHAKLVRRLPVSDIQRLAYGSALSGLIGRRASEQLGHQRSPVGCLNGSGSTDGDSEFLSELQALSAIWKHPALFQLWPQHPSWNDCASRQAVLFRFYPELLLDLVQDYQ